MFCYGKHWNLQTKSYEDSRNNYDHASIPSIPNFFQSLITRILQQTNEYISNDYKHGSAFPISTPDTCIVNYYTPSSGKLNVHRDQDESKKSIDTGYPVISFSIGDSAQFLYGSHKIKDSTITGNKDKYSSIRLSSGDILLFGNEARLIFHGIEKINPNTSPRGLYMRPGRLNLTFRTL
jgi:alkylated DNA repair dioxygenase AlkB